MSKTLKSIITTLLLSFASTSSAAVNPRVLVQTDLGNLTIELLPHDAPISVKNFLEYVDSNFYSGTIFQRVVPGFFIQGGGLTTDFTIKPTRAPVKNESNNGLKNEYQMVAMAHTEGGNASSNDLAASQFFINMQHNPALNANGKKSGYTVFGKVIEGIEIAEKISLQPRGMYENFPEAPNLAVHIIKIDRIGANKPTIDSNTENEPKTTETPHSGDLPMGLPQ